MKALPTKDDLHPDGIRIVVAWPAMKVGMSVFVPCLNTDEAKKQIDKIAAERGWKMQTQVRIEDGNFGVRTWRTV